MHTIHPVEDCAGKSMWWFGTYLKDHPTNRKWLVTLVSKSPKSQHIGCDYGYEPLTKWDDLPSRMTFFPECVARVPVSLWGSGGWGCVRSTLRSRAQPSATVRNRSREDRMAVPMGSFAEVVLFGGFRRLVASFRVAGVALRDIQTCSATCRKSFCVAGAILLRRFQKMCCSFRGRRSTLDVSIVIFRGRRSTLDASCCVFFVNRIGRAASSGDKVQIPWQAWHFLTCAENWRKPRTKHRFWGCKFSGSKENS